MDFFKGIMMVPAGPNNTGECATGTMSVNKWRKDEIRVSAAEGKKNTPSNLLQLAENTYCYRRQAQAAIRKKRRDESECLSSCADCLLQQ